ncbi:hypothetical protein AB0M95_14380 [Sphaerisporangium sp. NPDC051017]|uniref:hypothetical protein n=1 Tax=Sphaerisporangium sp. NPDC051017 TaxID=3154636 RepID=UPI00343F4877
MTASLIGAIRLPDGALPEGGDDPTTGRLLAPATTAPPAADPYRPGLAVSGEASDR